jgi:hypothetical protein
MIERPLVPARSGMLRAALSRHEEHVIPNHGPGLRRGMASDDGQRGDTLMAFDQYHEPPHELPEETRTFARMILSLIEEAEAIDWYEQRMAVERDSAARAIMGDAQGEEFKHFGMDLEFLLRRKPKWRAVLQQILFHEGDIVQLGKQGEQAEEAGD